jgi:hypothetical protein
MGHSNVRMSKPERPGVMRASIILAWHLGQGGRWMVMMRRLGSGGSAILSVTGSCRYGAVIQTSLRLALRSRWSIQLTFQKKLTNINESEQRRIQIRTTAIKYGHYRIQGAVLIRRLCLQIRTVSKGNSAGQIDMLA